MLNQWEGVDLLAELRRKVEHLEGKVESFQAKVATVYVKVERIAGKVESVEFISQVTGESRTY